MQTWEICCQILPPFPPPLSTGFNLLAVCVDGGGLGVIPYMRQYRDVGQGCAAGIGILFISDAIQFLRHFSQNILTSYKVRSL